LDGVIMDASFAVQPPRHCLEPSAFVTGLARVPSGIQGEGSLLRFEQYERHTAWDNPGGLANRSGAGDLDVIIYSARKWAQLALAGNPTVLLILFVPDKEVVFRNRVGAELVDLNEVVEAVASAEADLRRLRDSSSLPDQPDRHWVDEWLHQAHLNYWQA
jgi:RNA repair pathway DNA polymerase beta family